jgi:hypothetical protein
MKRLAKYLPWEDSPLFSPFGNKLAWIYDNVWVEWVDTDIATYSLFCSFYLQYSGDGNNISDGELDHIIDDSHDFPMGVFSCPDPDEIVRFRNNK